MGEFVIAIVSVSLYLCCCLFCFVFFCFFFLGWVFSLFTSSILSCPPISGDEAWALALTSDRPIISHILWSFPSLRAQTAHCCSPSPSIRASSSCSLFVPIFFSFSLLLNPEWPHCLLMGCCSETTEGKHRLSSWTTDPKTPPSAAPPPWPAASSVNLWSDLNLMSKWWCQLVRRGQLGLGVLTISGHPEIQPYASQISSALSIFFVLSCPHCVHPGSDVAYHCELCDWNNHLNCNAPPLNCVPKEPWQCKTQMCFTFAG